MAQEVPALEPFPEKADWLPGVTRLGDAIETFGVPVCVRMVNVFALVAEANTFPLESNAWIVTSAWVVAVHGCHSP